MKTERNLKIEVVENLSKKEENEVLRINYDNLKQNGGQLHNHGILKHNYAVLAKLNETIVGYTLLLRGVYDFKDLYVMQVAVDRKYHHLGIGSKMYGYVNEHAKGYSMLTSNVNPTNYVSQKFHEKCGFQKCGVNNLGLIYVKNITKDIKNTFENAKPCYTEFNQTINDLQKN